MKSLLKTLNIIEYIIMQEGRPVLPTELSQKLEINIACCVRILKTLAKRSFLTQISRNQGYVTGPMFCLDTTRHNIYQELVFRAHEELDALAQEFHCLVNLSIIHNHKRFLLYFTGHTSKNVLKPLVQLDWCFHDFATDQLLISTMENAERQRIWDVIGIPADFADKSKLDDYLANLRRRQYVYFYKEKSNKWIIGVLLEISEKITCAFAMSVTNYSEIHYTLEHALQAKERILQKYHRNELQP